MSQPIEDWIASSSDGRKPPPAHRWSTSGRMQDGPRGFGLMPGARSLAARRHPSPAEEAHRLHRIKTRQVSEQELKRFDDQEPEEPQVEASEELIKLKRSMSLDDSEGSNITTRGGRRRGGPTLKLDTSWTQEQRGRSRVQAPQRSVSRPRSPHFSSLRLYEGVEIRDFSQAVLPEFFGISELLVDLQGIAEGNDIVPPPVADHIESTETTDWLKATHVMDEYHLSDRDALFELDQLRDITLAAHECRSEEEPLSAWNIRVHHRLLQLALIGSQANLQSISDATIIPALNPRSILTLDPFAPPTVQFCMTLEPTLPQSDAIARLLEAQPENFRSLNQTKHPALRFRPGLVPIQTTTGRACESGTEGLATWCRAWLRRVRQLGVFDRRVGRIPAMPLIHTVGHDWYLLLTWEEEDAAQPQFLVRLGLREPTLVVLSELHIGHTRSIGGLYKIMAAVRRLSVWADGPFRKWFKEGIKKSSSDGTRASGSQQRPERAGEASGSAPVRPAATAGRGRLILPKPGGTGNGETTE